MWRVALPNFVSDAFCNEPAPVFGPGTQRCAVSSDVGLEKLRYSTKRNSDGEESFIKYGH